MAGANWNCPAATPLLPHASTNVGVVGPVDTPTGIAANSQATSSASASTRWTTATGSRRARAGPDGTGTSRRLGVIWRTQHPALRDTDLWHPRPGAKAK